MYWRSAIFDFWNKFLAAHSIQYWSWYVGVCQSVCLWIRVGNISKASPRGFPQLLFLLPQYSRNVCSYSHGFATRFPPSAFPHRPLVCMWVDRGVLLTCVSMSWLPSGLLLNTATSGLSLALELIIIIIKQRLISRRNMPEDITRARYAN